MTLRGLFRAARNRFARRKGEPLSAEEAALLRELQADRGPIGREDTVWGHGPGVHPEDRAAWEWLAEDVPSDLKEWADRIRDEMPHLPAGSVLYDLDAGLGRTESTSVFRARVTQFHRAVLEAFRRVTHPDEWIYAIDEPEAGYGYCYRFWPHRATDSTKWYVSPVPDGDDEYFVSHDFSWGLLALFGGFPHADWQVCAFGQRLLDALAQDPPPALSTVLQGDAFSQGDPAERALETETAILMFKLGLNCALAQEYDVWTPDLERRYREVQRLEEDPGSRSIEKYLEALAGLIARVELALDKAGVEYTPAMSPSGDESSSI